MLPVRARGCVRVLAAAMLVGALLACKKSDPKAEIAKKVAPLAAPVAAKVKSLESLGGAVAAAPHLKADGVDTSGVPLSIASETSSGDRNALIVYAEDLPDPTTAAAGSYTMEESRVFRTCFRLSRGLAAYVPDHRLEAAWKNCAALGYALVVRTIARKGPVVAKDKQSFTAGSHVGEILVYRIDDQKLLGGFSFNLTSSDRVKFTGNDPTVEVMGDLVDQLESKIRTEVARLGSPP